MKFILAIIFMTLLSYSVQAQEFKHLKWQSILKKYVTKNGFVDYKKLKKNQQALNIYIYELGKNFPKNNDSKEIKLAYWINAYNALTVDLILRNYPVKSIKDIKNPWKQRLWKLGETWYNLETIEHGILRKMNEPRIHFAIVCASISCPKLQNEAFDASKLENQLTQVTKDFLADSNKNKLSENKLELSKIFQWFSKDFKQNGSLINFINTYSNIKTDSEARINYKDYNWNLNE